MSGRALGLWIGILLLAVVLAFAGHASADMDAPTLSAKPVVDADIGETEWGIANNYEFSAPRTGSSSVRMGYLDTSGEIALGFVLGDESDKDDDELEVYIAPRRVEAGDDTVSDDLKLVIQADGSWELYEGNGSGFPTFSADSGDSPEDTGQRWDFEVHRTASSWVVEMLVDIGSFEASDQIRMAFAQTDVNALDEAKSSKRPNDLNPEKPASWEHTVLSGKPSNLQIRVVPENMEAGVGGDIHVTLPANANGGRLTVSKKGPGEKSYTPVGTRDPGTPGENVFFFAPENVGTYQVTAQWEGDENYARRETSPLKVKVARPTPDGPTVLETGSMRVSFAVENEGTAGEWHYLNTRVWATDGDGNVLPLVRLDGSNSCRKEPWVGFANMGDGPMILHFDPPVRRSAIALTSPRDAFTATWQGYTAQDTLKEEDTQSGKCGSPVFAGVGDIEDTIERIEISYNGEDKREVMDVAFAHPRTSTAPQTVARAVPSPLRPSGAATVHASAGTPHRLTELNVTVTSGTQTLGSQTCERPSSQVWIDCPVDVTLPAGTGSVEAEITSTTLDGQTFTATETLQTVVDRTPPQASLLPQPMAAPPGGAVSIEAEATDGSGLASITVRGFTESGRSLVNETCRPTQTNVRSFCKVAVTPPEDDLTLVEATFTDNAGNSVTVGPKPVPVRGDDGDGDGLPDDLETDIGTSPQNTDTDADGLSDGWEVLGVDRNGDGTAELDLAARGADPQVQDLFLEFDWAKTEDTDYEIDYGAIQLVRNVFAAHGIRVHTDVSDDGGPFDPTRFDHAHEAHRHLMDPARAGVYMHVISGPHGGPAATSGGMILMNPPDTGEQIAGRVGAQLLHEIGHHLTLGHGGGGEVEKDGNTRQIAYAENHKPNYLSVMNDAYAWGIIVDTTGGLIRVPTYAGIAIDDLDESALDEPKGLGFDIGAFEETLRAGPTKIVEENTITGLRLRYTCPQDGPTRWALAPGPVDWNCNGSSGDTGVTADINRGGANSGTSKLYSRMDWGTLSLEGPPCPQYGYMLTDDEDQPSDRSGHEASYPPLGLAPCPLRPVPQMPLDKSAQSSVQVAPSPGSPIEEADRRDNDGDGITDDGFADADNDGVVNLIDDCPTVSEPGQPDRDRDGEGDLCSNQPTPVRDLEAKGGPAGVQLSWSPVLDAWGYNVYRIADGTVDRLGDSFPTTASTSYLDEVGATGDRYIVRAVNTLADQGPPASSVATTGGPNGTDGNSSTNGSDTPREGVPGPGVLVALGAAAATAVAVRRRR